METGILDVRTRDLLIHRSNSLCRFVLMQTLSIRVFQLLASTKLHLVNSEIIELLNGRIGIEQAAW